MEAVSTINSEKKARASIVPKSWAYDECVTGGRDLRIDFMRGYVMFILVIIHIDIFSVFNFIVWEKIGVVSGGEGFVILSGLILGVVNRKKIERSGLEGVVDATLSRGFQIYRVNVAIIFSVLAISTIPFLDPSSITTFTNHGTGQVYQLYPSLNEPFKEILYKTMTLKVGSQQTQVLGLYVVLILLSPLAFLAFKKGRTMEFLCVCWILYLSNWAHPSRPTGAQFEYAFPVLSWQLTFFHAMAFGYYRDEITAWFVGYKRQVIYVISGVLFVGFAIFSWNNPNPGLPEWAKLNLIPGDQFSTIYHEYFRKNTLGILRIINYLVVLIVLYRLLTIFWKPLNRLLGWWCVPIGQASLYVFILHLAMCMVVDNIHYYSNLEPHFESGNIWLTTAAHGFVLLALWVLVVNKFAFKWIPR